MEKEGEAGALGMSAVSEVGKEGVCGRAGELEVLLEPASGRNQVWRGEVGTLDCVWREKRGCERLKHPGHTMLLVCAVVLNLIFPSLVIPILEMRKAEVHNG